MSWFLAPLIYFIVCSLNLWWAQDVLGRDILKRRSTYLSLYPGQASLPSFYLSDFKSAPTKRIEPFSILPICLYWARWWGHFQNNQTFYHAMENVTMYLLNITTDKTSQAITPFDFFGYFNFFGFYHNITSFFLLVKLLAKYLVPLHNYTRFSAQWCWKVLNTQLCLLSCKVASLFLAPRLT